MKIALTVLAALMILMGGVWVLQGLNVAFAPKSFMTGNISWTGWGAFLLALGAGLLVWVYTRKPKA